MQQANFAYVANDPAVLAVSIFVERDWLREELRADVLAAGLAVLESAPLDSLIEGEVRPLGDVVLIDCPSLNAAGLAALARIDVRAARAGARLVVSTSVDALDDVFACCDQSAPQILVEPSRAERVVALGRVLAEVPRLRVRELSEEDRLTLLRLTEQVGRLAERLDAFAGGPAFGAGSVADRAADGEGLRFESPSPGYRNPPPGDPAERLTRAARPPLPDPRLVRKIIRQRQLRARHFDGELFADPAWDILLDLTAARAEHIRVSVTSLCIASGVPPTTALRWITQMTEAGLLQRVEDETDRRRAFIALTDNAAEAMARYFAELGRNAAQLV